MSRNEEYMESMLRDLGSVYYQTLRGEASEADVARAVESVRTHEAVSSHEGREAGSREAGPRAAVPRQGRWRVIDVMATEVITVDKNMPYKQVARLLAENELTALPVTSGGGHVLGVVSEADVLRKEERTFSRLGSGLPRRTHRERKQAEAVTAGTLMTAPAITIHPDAPLGAAARLMNGRHITRLPVVNSDKELIGMVSRRDLLSVFLRPDSEIAAEVSADLATIKAEGPVQVAASVAGGEVTLTGRLPSADLISEAVRVVASEIVLRIYLTIGFVALLVVSVTFGQRSASRLALIENGYAPSLELSRNLQEELGKLQRTMQDAVAAMDSDMVASTSDIRDAFHAALDTALTNPVADSTEITNLRGQFDGYYSVARGATAQMLRAEAGASTVSASPTPIRTMGHQPAASTGTVTAHCVVQATAMIASAGTCDCAIAAAPASLTALHHCAGSCSAPPPGSRFVAIWLSAEAATWPRLETTAALTLPDPMSIAST